MTIQGMNDNVCSVQYVSNGDSFIAKDAYDECMDVMLPTMLHVKAHFEYVMEMEENGEAHGPYKIPHEGKVYTVTVTGGPGGETVLHVFGNKGFMFHVETSAQA